MNDYDDNDEYVEEDRPKSTGKTVTIVILLLMLLGALSYIGYFDIYIPYYEEPNKVTIEDEEDEEREMYVSEVVKMQDKLNDYLYFANNFDKGNVDEISNQELLLFALHKIGEFKEEIPKEEIEDIVETYFGSNVKLEHEDILCVVENIALYNFKDDKYVLNESHPGHGGASYTGGDVHIISGDVDLKNKEYIIKGRILYTLEGLTGINVDTRFYKSVEDIESNNPIINNDLEPKTYDDVSSFLPVTTFKFTKKGNEYYLKSVNID